MPTVQAHEIPAQARKRADYGIDAPGVVRNLLGAGVACLSLGLTFWLFQHDANPSGGLISLLAGVFSAASFFLTVLWLVWGSRVGKRAERDRLVNGIHWRGDERVLDVGCGRGLLLIAVARRLRHGSGRVVGLDIWQRANQSGNSASTAQENAVREGVDDRIELQTGDARDIPFPDGSFDVVVTSLALHSIPDREGREKALREIARVLKPGGWAAILDIMHVAHYAQVMDEIGLRDIRVSPLRWRICPPARRVSGQKPFGLR